MINARGLFSELINAGLPVVGVSSDGAVNWGNAEPSTAQETAAAQIVADHARRGGVMPAAELVIRRRTATAATARAEIERSPLARAILEDGDLSTWTTEEIVEAQGRIIRYLANEIYINWPAWKRAARGGK